MTPALEYTRLILLRGTVKNGSTDELFIKRGLLLRDRSLFMRAHQKLLDTQQVTYPLLVVDARKTRALRRRKEKRPGTFTFLEDDTLF